jgi:hypothetical protein
MDFSIPQGAYTQVVPRRSWFSRILLLLTFIVVTVSLVVYMGEQYNWFRSSDAWQAVFLSNGQVYFGHVVKTTPSSVVLQDIYYLQASGPLQAGAEQQQKDLALVKLGAELHGPTDEMRINREHVLFVEDLKDDSKVVKAIEQHGLGK